jgi:hypothetical protein
MEMRKNIFSIVFVLLAGLCFSQQTLVVPPIYNRGTRFNADELADITDFITNALQRQNRFDVPDREALALMTEEQRFQMIDWSDETKSIQMGKAINANYLARSILSRLDGAVNLLQIRIIDVNTTGIVGRAQELEFTTPRDLRVKLDGFLHGVTSTITTGKAGAVQGAYMVGDRGPAGGWVFYDKGVVSNGWRYLEAAPAWTEFEAAWGANERDVGGTDFRIGTGKQNTQVIVEYLRGIGESGKAAQLCDSFSLNGYDDWFLPSLLEVDLMCKDLKLKGMGGFSTDWYWSSSAGFSSADIPFSMSVLFSADHPYYTSDDRNNLRSVRCVRAF